MIPHLEQFAGSEFLGARAVNVYSWFLQSLHLPGDVAECGVFKGETSRELLRFLEGNKIPKNLHMFDTFEGLPSLITAEERRLARGEELNVGQYRARLEEVTNIMSGLNRYKIHKGLFSDTFADFSEPLCFIHADADLYQSTKEIILLADKLLVPGGHIVFDDYNNDLFPGVSLAIERHLNPKKYLIVPSTTSIQCFVTKL